MCAREALAGFDGSLVVLSGDTPLMRAETIAGLVAMRERSGAAVHRAHDANLPNPTGYGRIVARAATATSTAIVEEKDCTPEQRRIDEVNTGTYCFDAAVLFAHLDRLTTDNAQGEYYLTDMIAVFRAEGLTVVGAARPTTRSRRIGVNSPRPARRGDARSCSAASTSAHMLAGVTMTAPDLVWIGPDVTLGRDVELLPMTFLFGATTRRRPRASSARTRASPTRVVAEDARRRLVASCSARRSGRARPSGPWPTCARAPCSRRDAKAGTCVEIKNSDGGRGQQGAAPVLHRRRDDRRGRQRRRRLDHLQLRRRAASIRPSSATARSSALIRCSWRRSRSARARSPQRAARSPTTCPPDALAIERTEQRHHRRMGCSARASARSSRHSDKERIERWASTASA